MDDRRGPVLCVEVVAAGDEGGNGQRQKGPREGRIPDGVGNPRYVGGVRANPPLLKSQNQKHIAVPLACLKVPKAQVVGVWSWT